MMAAYMAKPKSFRFLSQLDLFLHKIFVSQKIQNTCRVSFFAKGVGFPGGCFFETRKEFP